MAKIKNIDYTRCWWGYRDIGTLTLLVGMQSGSVILKYNTAVSYKVRDTLIWQAISAWEFTPKNKKYIYTKDHTEIFIAASFVVAKNYIQPKWPLMDKQSVYIMHNTGILQRNKPLIHVTTQINLHDTTWVKKAGIKTYSSVIPFLWHSWKAKLQ